MEIQQDRGVPEESLPEWYREMPEVDFVGAWFLRAFSDLSTERQIGMALGPIPYSQVLAYASREGLDPAMMAVFPRIILTLDRAYLKWTQDDTERKTKKTAK